MAGEGVMHMMRNHLGLCVQGESVHVLNRKHKYCSAYATMSHGQ